ADDDEVWKDLVARFYDEREDIADQRRRVAWPDAENLSAPGEREDDSASSRIGDLLAGRARKEKDEANGADDADADEEAEEALRRAEAELEGHYEPPPPSPLIQGDRVGVAAWFGLLSAPVVLFGSAFLSISLPTWLMLLLVLAFLSSFVVLVLRMTDNRPPGDDGPDDGAVFGPLRFDVPLTPSFAVYRACALIYALLAVVRHHQYLVRPWLAWGVLVVMAVWTVATAYGYSRPGQRTWRLVVADLAVALGCLFATALAASPFY